MKKPLAEWQEVLKMINGVIIPSGRTFTDIVATRSCPSHSAFWWVIPQSLNAIICLLYHNSVARHVDGYAPKKTLQSR
jgi:hypothetical protein